jgi:hypothetical protein
MSLSRKRTADNAMTNNNLNNFTSGGGNLGGYNPSNYASSEVGDQDFGSRAPR